MHWVTLFDIEKSGFKDWWPLSFVLILLPVTGFLAFAPNGFYQRALDRLPRHLLQVGLTGPSRRVFGIVGLMIAVAFSASSALGLYSSYRTLRAARETGAFRTVEGQVSHYQCCKSVSFDVDGIAFKYSSDVLTSAFNDDGGPFDPGGPVNAGMHVRIAYVGRPNGGDYYSRQIIRLEVRQ